MATIAFGDAYTLGEGQFSLIQLPLDLFKKVLLTTTAVFLVSLAPAFGTPCSLPGLTRGLPMEQVQDDPTVTFRMKGRENEEAVLVTENQTFVVRRGETSNTQMLFECSIESLIGLSDVGGTNKPRPRFPAPPAKPKCESLSSAQHPPSTPLSTSTHTSTPALPRSLPPGLRSGLAEFVARGRFLPGSCPDRAITPCTSTRNELGKSNTDFWWTASTGPSPQPPPRALTAGA